MSKSNFAKLELDDIPVINLGKFILDKMKEHDPDSIALVAGETDMSYTYQQLINRTELAAAGFQKMGMKKDDVLCVVAPNHLDYIEAFYATSLLYATFQPVNPLYAKEQVTPHMKLRGGVEFITEIQRTASGKILRRQLRERAREFAAGKNE